MSAKRIGREIRAVYANRRSSETIVTRPAYAKKVITTVAIKEVENAIVNTDGTVSSS